MADGIRKFSEKVRSAVFSVQKTLVDRLIGKEVVRDGVAFRVIEADQENGVLIVSNLKTADGQTSRFAIRSFLGKAVEVIDGE